MLNRSDARLRAAVLNLPLERTVAVFGSATEAETPDPGDIDVWVSDMAEQRVAELRSTCPELDISTPRILSATAKRAEQELRAPGAVPLVAAVQSLAARGLLIQGKTPVPSLTRCQIQATFRNLYIARARAASVRALAHARAGMRSQTHFEHGAWLLAVALAGDRWRMAKRLSGVEATIVLGTTTEVDLVDAVYAAGVEAIPESCP